VSLTVWRITKTGGGGSNGSGTQRWNTPGASVLYAAQSQALAVLEMLAHLEGQELHQAYELIGIELPDSFIERVDGHKLRADWRSDPPPADLKEIGDRWVEQQRSAALCVPSALLPCECNFLLNPEHPDFQKLAMNDPIPFRFDHRLTKQK
jgi:RES domain-containing protein